MRSTLVVTLTLAILPCVGWPQTRTPAEMITRMESDAMYGSDLASLPKGTPADKNLAFREMLHLPNPPRPPAISGTVYAAALRHAVPKAAAKAHDRARKLFGSGKVSDAARELEKAVALDPDFAEAHENLGALYIKLGRPAEAEPHSRRAIELNPGLASAHSNYATTLAANGNFPEAEKAGRRAIELDPVSVPVLTDVAWAFYLGRHYQDAIEMASRAIESFDLSSYDLILSSSHAVAKGVRTREGQVHVSYCHTPMRYAWDLRGQYLGVRGLDRGIRGIVVHHLLDRLQDWDRASSGRVSKFNQRFSGISFKR